MSFFVTTPIYYVNAPPHLGHAYSTVAADILARHMRQRGEEVFFLTGTDEHGEPVAQAAEREGVTPRELVDRNAQHFQALLPKLESSNNFFIRTSDPRHEAKVAEIMQSLYDKGYIYSGVYEGWYCPRCADFKTDSELLEGNRCPIHQIELIRERENNYFFKLSQFQSQLEQLYELNPQFVLPRHRYNEAKSFIKQGLKDVSVSRANLKWGVTVPWDKEQVFYVWFDALLNYLTALSFANEQEDLTSKFWPPNFHILGKDILKFHAVFWPAILMAAGFGLPQHLFIHGYLLLDGQKMSKSLGNVLDPIAVVDRYGADALRFYLFRDVSFGQDGVVSTPALHSRYTTELANEYGNLASRVVALVIKYRAGKVPQALVDEKLGEDFQGLRERFCQLLDLAQISEALNLVWERVRRLNRYIEEQAPWKMAKDETKKDQLDQVLLSVTEALRVVTILLYPYIPMATVKLLQAIDAEELLLANAEYGLRQGGNCVKKLEPLFPRLEDEL